MPPTIKSSEKYKSLILKYHYKNPLLKFTPLSKLIIKEEGLKIKAGVFRRMIPIVLSQEIKYDKDVFAEIEDMIIPESLYKERPKFVIPNSVTKLLVLGDMHLPFHDVVAIKTALRYGEEKGIDGILLNGDIIDNYSFSRYIKIPNLRRPVEEIEIAKSFLSKLSKKFSCKIYYKFGNHENRWERYILQNAPDLFGIPEITLPEILHLDSYGIENIDERAVIEFGKLSIIHGHEIWGGGINVARNFRIKSRVSILFNHFHRFQTDIVPTLDGKHQGAWAVACLCGLKPDYMPVNDWVHGCAVVERDAEGYFTVKNKQIMNGRII